MNDGPGTQAGRAAPAGRALPWRPSSYIGRHWRGELSLGVSYLVNGILLGVVAFGATKLFFLADIQSAPRTWLLLINAWLAFLILVAAWQLVGSFRSANQVIQARRLVQQGAGWAHLARGMVVLGAVSLAAQTVLHTIPSSFASLKIVFGTDPTPRHVLRVMDGGTSLELSGGIGYGTALEVRALLDASPGVRRIVLESRGGYVLEAEEIGRLVQERKLATSSMGFCASACTVAFMAGQERYLGPDGRLGFHRYAFPGLSAEQEAALNLKGERTLIAAGVSPGFVAQAFATPSSDVWTPDQATLLDAHVVTRLGGGS